MKTLFPLILVVLLVGPGAAGDYLPLEIGNFWSYVSEDGATEMRVVSEQVPVFQGNPYQIEYTSSAGNHGLINYWTSEPDGGVLLWGFSRPNLGYLYQPPIRMVDAPLYVGKTWTETTDIYSLPDTTFVQTAETIFWVAEDPELTVPAGVFPTFGIDEFSPDLQVLLDSRFSLAGESRTNMSRYVSQWFSLGVGVVQVDYNFILQLETYTDHPVAVEVSSWGAVKALYRGTQ